MKWNEMKTQRLKFSWKAQKVIRKNMNHSFDKAVFNMFLSSFVSLFVLFAD